MCSPTICAKWFARTLTASSSSSMAFHNALLCMLLKRQGQLFWIERLGSFSAPKRCQTCQRRPSTAPTEHWRRLGLPADADYCALSTDAWCSSVDRPSVIAGSLICC
jgi:hypothetical protein